MANLDRKFNLVGKVTAKQEREIRVALESKDGVNHVITNKNDKTLTVGYTPGITNVQNIKETIESQGVDVSDKGDD
jgi:hypothetical protein